MSHTNAIFAYDIVPSPAMLDEDLCRLSQPSWAHPISKPKVQKGSCASSSPTLYHGPEIEKQRARTLQMLGFELSAATPTSSTPLLAANDTPVQYTRSPFEQLEIDEEQSVEISAELRHQATQGRARRLRNRIGLACFIFVGIVVLADLLFVGPATVLSKF